MQVCTYIQHIMGYFKANEVTHLPMPATSFESLPLVSRSVHSCGIVQAKYMPPSNYLEGVNSRVVSKTMRTTVINWIVNVHKKFKLKQASSHAHRH